MNFVSKVDFWKVTHFHFMSTLKNMAPKRLREELSDSENVSNKLLSSLYLQSQRGQFCDIKITLDCGEILVHSCVLATFSPCFENILKCPESEGLDNLQVVKVCGNRSDSSLNAGITCDWSIKHPLEIKLSSMDTGNSFEQNMDCMDCFTKVIAFMYLGKIHISREHLAHIKYLSEILKVSELLIICNNYNNPEATGVECQERQLSKKTLKPNLIKEKIGSSDEDIDEQKSPNTKLSHKSLQTTCDLPESRDNIVKYVDVKNSFLNIQSRNEQKGPYSCSECQLKFPTSTLFCKHRETHLGKLYPCYACTYSSHKAFELLKHILESNHQEKVCSLCLFEAANSDELKEHLQQHNHPKPFFCSVCNLRFPTRTALKLHSPKHSTETPFCCSVCNRGFKWKHGLQSHMVIHTTEKKHLCAQCGYSTAHKSTFNAHELVHTGFTYKCPEADCTFKTTLKRNISAHLATHSNEKPYQCEICGQAFSQSKNLRRHALKHDTSALPYSCPLCLFESMRVDKLKYHFKKHHPDDDEKLLNVKRKKWSRESGTKEVSEILLSKNFGHVTVSKDINDLNSDNLTTPTIVTLTTNEQMEAESSENVIQNLLRSPLQQIAVHTEAAVGTDTHVPFKALSQNTVKLSSTNGLEVIGHDEVESVHDFSEDISVKTVIVDNTNVQNEVALSLQCSERSLDLLKDFKSLASSNLYNTSNDSVGMISTSKTNLITDNIEHSVVSIAGDDAVTAMIVENDDVPEVAGSIALTVVPSDISHLTHIENDSESTNISTTETLKQDVENQLIQTILVDELSVPHLYPDDIGRTTFLVTTIDSKVPQFYSEGDGNVMHLSDFGVSLAGNENSTILMDELNTIQTILVPAIVNNSIPTETSADVNSSH